jgi:hypothetical protein
MKIDPFDPFEAWQKFQSGESPKLLKEDLDVKKLHEPADFAKEGEQFVKETNAHLTVLSHFAKDKNLPELAAAIRRCQSEVGKLEHVMKSVSHNAQAKERVESGKPGDTFRKV